MNPPICAVVVTYKASSHISELLNALLTQVQRIYVVDNGSEPSIIAMLREYAARHPEAMLLTCNEHNLGIATAQNQGIRQALTDGCKWVLLMDDDSLPEPSMVQTMLSAWQKQNDQTIGIIAPSLMEQNISSANHYLVPWHGVGFKRKTITPHKNRVDVVTVIASGSMIRTDVFKRAGLMRDGFFIDYVDHEFHLRARTHGYRIMVVGSAVLQHRQGHKRRGQMMGIAITTLNYNPMRYYYIFRNRVFFVRLYGTQFPFIIAHNMLACALDILRIISLETDKGAKLRAMLRGLKDGVMQAIPGAPIV